MTTDSSYQLPFQLGGGDRQTDTQTPPPVTIHSSSLAAASSTTISPFHSPVPEATSMSSMASESTSASVTGAGAGAGVPPSSSSVSGGGYTVTMAMPALPPAASSSSFLPLAPPSTLGPGGAAAASSSSSHPYQHHIRGPESAFMMTSSTVESSPSSTAAATVSVPRVISGLSATSSEENLYARSGGTAHITTASAAGTLSVTTTEVSAAHRVIAAPMGVGTSAGASASAANPASAKKSKAANAKTSGGDGETSGHGDNNAGTTGTGTGRRQKRLERNRESARLSRRRRKQYLEVLEERVTELSNEMDTLRRAHVAVAVSTIQQKRAANELLQLQQQQQQQAATAHPEQQQQMIIPSYNNNNNSSSSSLLFYTSPELILASVFRSQQLKSFALPPSYKFILWLTLQNDTYFRGGRAASERLSAARIGERMLQSGNDRVTPIQSMWPLVCHEVCLSYEQEEKARNFQRSLLQTPESWVDRHTAFSCDKAMDTAQEALESTAARVAQREQRGATTLLSAQQRANLLAYTTRNRQLIARKIAEKVNPSTCCAALYDERFQTSPEQHVAGNLYTLNYRLRKVLEKTGPSAPLVTGLAKKKLAVRPCFETLGARSGEGKEDGSNGGRGLSREASFASTGSLKRNCSEISMDTSHLDTGDESQRQAIPPISPEDAQATAMPLIEQVLGHLKEIIPPPPVPTAVMSSSFSSMPTMTMSSPVYSSVQALAQQKHQQQQQVALPPMTYAPAPIQQYQQQQYVLPAPTPVASMSLQLQQLQPFVQPTQQPPQQQHQVQMQHYQVPQPGQSQQQHQVLLPSPVQHVQYAAPPVEQQLLQQQQQVQYTTLPGAVYSTSQEVQYAVAPVQQEQQQVHFSLPVDSRHSVAAFAAGSAQIPNPLEDNGGSGPPQSKHHRVSSFLPAHLNVVPEEMWPDNDDKEFLMSLADEDWAIGAGVEMEY